MIGKNFPYCLNPSHTPTFTYRDIKSIPCPHMIKSLVRIVDIFWKCPDDPDFCLPTEIWNLVDWFENISSHFQDHEDYFFNCHSPLSSGQSSSIFYGIILLWALRRDVTLAHLSPCCYIHFTENRNLLDFSFQIILLYYFLKLNNISQQKFLNSQNTNLS